ncbi:hypothetical protein [Mycetocola zhujimingii]|nr:hypothetical protein [Mycetocola zhujimingii]
MVGIVLRFIAHVAGLVWRYGVSKVNQIIAWIKRNHKTVQLWLERGVTYGTIIGWIMNTLGMG